MIFLDTNVLKGVSLRGAEAELLRVLREAAAERAATAETVLVELAAQQAILYEKKAKAAQDALDALRKASPWTTTPRMADSDPGQAREYWRKQYEKVVESIKPSIEVYEEALFREANVLPPCKMVGKDDKTGARDAAIWLTAVEYARTHPDQTVRFVSKDADFRRVTESGRSLLDDLEGMEDRFFMYTTLGDVLAEFARQSDTSEEQVASLLGSSAYLDVVRRLAEVGYLASPLSSYPWLSLPPHSAPEKLAAGVRVKLAEVVDPRAYEIVGHTWYVANARWVVACPSVEAEGHLYFLQSWSTRVMASEDPESGGVTVLKSTAFQNPEPADTESFPELAGRLVSDAVMADILRAARGKSYIAELLQESGRRPVYYAVRDGLFAAADPAPFDFTLFDMAQAADLPEDLDADGE